MRTPKNHDTEAPQGTQAADLINTKGKSQEEIESLQVAEGARQSEWQAPSFVGDLFMGRLRAGSVIPYPEQDEEDRKIGDAYIAKLGAFLRDHVDADAIDEKGEIPKDVMKGLAELGAFGMKIPKEYGGLGLSQVNYNRALALVCSHDGSIAATLSAHQSIGVPQPLRLFGTPEQKQKYLPRMAKGEVSAFALTEPEVGSDPARMSTTATPTPDGKHYILNGTKLWCTNGAIADIMVVMAQTPPIQKNGREVKQITAFIVEKTMPGVEVLHRCRFMGLNGIQNALIRFKDVKIPAENVLWGTGKGLRLALITLNAGRLSIPAVCIGAARQCLKEARLWGNERKQWGLPVGKHEAGVEKIANISADLFAMEAICWMAGTWVDRETQDIRIEAAMAKLFCSERSHNLVDTTMQLRGGRGYERAPSLRARGERPFPVERMYRDSRINQIVEGTSDILRLFIARECLDKHLRVAGDVLNPKLPIPKRLAAVVKSAVFYAGWYPWQWIGPLFTLFPRYAGLGRLGKHMRFAARTSHRLARTAFHLMLLNGPKLEKKQLTMMRLVDIATDLFAIAATIGRAKARDGKQEYGNVIDVADVFCWNARRRIEASFRALSNNSDGLKHRLTRGILEGNVTWLERETVPQK